MKTYRRMDSPSESRVSQYSTLPVLDLNSSKPLPARLFTQDGERLRPDLIDNANFCQTSGESIDVDSLFCRCPDCAAPLSVRIWSMTLDCWCCGLSIAIEDVRQRQTTTTKRQLDSQAESMKSDGVVIPDQRREKLRIIPGAPVPIPPTSPLGRKKQHSTDSMPAWLSSLLLHLLLLIILALLHLRTGEPGDDTITLSTKVSPADVEDVESEYIDPVEETVYDLPVPDADQPRTERQRQALILADQEAKTIRMDPDAESPELPDLFALKRAIGMDPHRRTLAVRDPRIRIEMVRREGGTTLTEAAVSRGLKWMANHQSEDGSWSLDRFHRCPNCRGRCGGRGQMTSDSAGTSLCLLPFLGAGQTHFTGPYQDVVAKGLRWLIAHQKENGDLRGSSRGSSGMYAHGQAAIVLCEAYGLTQDESLRGPAERAIEFIVYAQHSAGGWRYAPHEPGDTSVVGWQLMALQSAKAAGLEVPEETLAKASQYLDSCAHYDGALYGYQPRRAHTPTMSAEALLCRMYLGWKKDNPALEAGIAYLVDRHLPSRHEFNIYYWYYGTQALHHFGGRPWREWNRRIRDILVDTQIKFGHEAGSWDPNGPFGRAGRIYVTSLAVCTLEVYYRHAPIFRQIDLE